MLGWVIQISLISIIFIFLVHHLIGFFKSTLTVPKIKDLVNCPVQKYQHILNTLNDTSSISTISPTYTSEDLLPSDASTKPQMSMKDELKQFLKKQVVPESANFDYYREYNEPLPP